MSDTITRKQAEAALASVREQFAAYLGDGADQPSLKDPGEECHAYAIAWEGGPYEWTYIAFDGGFDDEMYLAARDAGATDEQARNAASKPAVKPPAGVFPDPVNHWCLGLYPDE